MLEKIKTLLDISDSSKDAKINIQIDLVKQMIMNDCNIDIFPLELEAVVVDLIVNKALNQTKVQSSGSVSFKHQVSEADLANYENQLSGFRKIRVV